MTALSPEAVRILRTLDVAAARKLWVKWVADQSADGRPDEQQILAGLHMARRRYVEVFTLEERRTSTVWLITHGYPFPDTSLTRKRRKV